MRGCLKAVWFWAGMIIILIYFGKINDAGATRKMTCRKPDSMVFMDDHGIEAEYAIVVEKETQRLALYRFNGSYEELLKVKCSTGEVSGAKTRSGDKKTPEGVYFFTKAVGKKYLSAVYGDMAFPMNYPNLADQLYGRKGNSIWMHGTNKKIKDRDSNGCIVLANNDIKKLAPYITLNRTPIIVTDRVHFTDSQKDRQLQSRVVDWIEAWNSALAKGGYKEYRALYHPDAGPDTGWWKDWQEIRSKIASHRLELSVQMDKLSIYRHRDVFTAVFDQILKAGEQTVRVGSRRVYFQEKGDRFKMIGIQPASDYNRRRDAALPYPLLTAGRELLAYHNARQDIAKLLDRWITAWSNKDIEIYGACYARDFRFRWMDRKAWLKKKRRLNRQYRYISVTKENVVISTGLKRSTVTFTQRYESSGYRAVGRKKLILKCEDGKWKIYREQWKKI